MSNQLCRAWVSPMCLGLWWVVWAGLGKAGLLSLSLPVALQHTHSVQGGLQYSWLPLNMDLGIRDSLNVSFLGWPVLDLVACSSIGFHHFLVGVVCQGCCLQ